MKKRSTKKTVQLSKSFTPKFWCEADGRCAVVKEIKRRYDELKRDAGCNSYQKDILCQRAVFLAVQIETVERRAVERGEFSANHYTVMINTLLGILKALGLEKQFSKVVELDDYLEANE